MTRAPAPSRRGFSLIELMVVVAIIAVLMAISLPLVHGLTGGSSTFSAVNQVSATLSAARTIALRDGRDTAVFFFLNTSGSITVRALERNYDVNNIGFVGIDDHPAELLPTGVHAAAPNFAAGADTTWITPTSAQALMVWFGPDGITRSSDPSLPAALVYYTAATDTATSPHAYLIGTDIPALVTPCLALYDQRDFETQSNSLSTWIGNSTNHIGDAQVLMFNRYTGSLLRK